MGADDEQIPNRTTEQLLYKNDTSSNTMLEIGLRVVNIFFGIELFSLINNNNY